MALKKVSARIEFEHDPESALETLRTMEDPAITAIEPVAVEVIAEKTPRMALSYYLSNESRSTTLTSQAETKIATWISENPDKASELINASRSSPAKDRSVFLLVSAIVESDVDSAIVWANTINNPGIKSRAHELLEKYKKK